jgi:hypothetical protein
MLRPTAVVLAGIALCVAPAAAVETEVTPTPATPPTLTVDQPANPASTKPGGPVLLSISLRLAPQIGNMVPQNIIPDFHFRAPNGNAVLLHRELVETSANNFHLNPATAINISPDVQKKGAVISGGWNCGTGQYYATVNAYIMDDNGIRSNTVRYTVHCNGG